MAETVEESREAFRYWTRVPTRWGDVDRMGHVNNAVYFTYAEQVRIEYLSARRESMVDSTEGSGGILAHAACDFVSQLRHPATLDIGLRVTRMGKSSLRTVALMFDGERLVARMEGIIVWFDYAQQVAVPIPEAMRAAVRQYEWVKPEE